MKIIQTTDNNADDYDVTDEYKTADDYDVTDEYKTADEHDTNRQKVFILEIWTFVSKIKFQYAPQFGQNCIIKIVQLKKIAQFNRYPKPVF